MQQYLDLMRHVLTVGITLSIIGLFLLLLSIFPAKERSRFTLYAIALHTVWLGVMVSIGYYSYTVLAMKSTHYSEVRLYLIHGGVFIVAIVCNAVFAKVLANKATADLMRKIRG